MDKQYTIWLYPQHGVWMAECNDPDVIEVMGSRYIPTPYKDTYPMNQVLAELRQRNPEYIVSVKNTPRGEFSNE